MADEKRGVDFPCHAKPKDQWCDSRGAGNFMGHTCASYPDLAYLPLVVEECGEVIQAAMKVVRFGTYHRYRTGPHKGRTNIEALAVEIGDLFEVVGNLNVSAKTIREAQEAKAEKLQMYGPHNWRPGIEDETAAGGRG